MTTQCRRDAPRRPRHQADPVFLAQPVPSLLLDPDLTIRAVNTAYSTAVRRPADDLVGMAMFEAFPDNPGDAEADGVANLGEEEVLGLLHQVHDITPIESEIVAVLRKLSNDSNVRLADVALALVYKAQSPGSLGLG